MPLGRQIVWFVDVKTPRTVRDQREPASESLGLSLVHLNKTLKKLRATGLISLDGRQVTVSNAAALAALGKLESKVREKRPLI